MIQSKRMISTLIKLLIVVHIMTSFSGSLLGSYEAYTKHTGYFAEYRDDIYTAGARGMIRGAAYPYLVCLRVPKVWETEKKLL